MKDPIEKINIVGTFLWPVVAVLLALLLLTINGLRDDITDVRRETQEIIKDISCLKEQIIYKNDYFADREKIIDYIKTVDDRIYKAQIEKTK